jgi:hypothetical protein
MPFRQYSGCWEIGQAGLEVLACANDETHKITCAEFLHAYATHLWASGDRDKTLQAVGEAVKLWQPIRRTMIDDDTLAELW